MDLVDRTVGHQIAVDLTVLDHTAVVDHTVVMDLRIVDHRIVGHCIAVGRHSRDIEDHERVVVVVGHADGEEVVGHADVEAVG